MNPYALLDPAVSALHHLLVQLAAVLPLPDQGARFAVALVLVTLAVRAALLPVAIRGLRARRARAALAPQLAALRRRHEGDPQRLLAESSKLHRDAGIAPTAGLLAALVQLPVLATVYRLAIVPTVAGSPNLLLSARLFGAPMAAHWPEVLAVGGGLAPGALALVVLLVALTVLAVASSRDVARLAEEGTPGPATGAGPAGVPAVIGRVTRLLPYGTLLVALVAPVAMGIYLLVTTAWSLAERRLLPRLVPAPL